MNEIFESNYNSEIALNIETDNSSIVYPFVKIIQRSSNELIEGTEKYNPNVKAGDIYDSITKTTFKEAKVIICGMKRFFAEWTNETRGKLVNRHLLNSNIVKNCRKEERKKSDGSIGYNLFTEDNNQLIETIGCVFIIKNNDGLKYIQVSLSVRDEKTLKRELEPLEIINDNYPKYLITLDYDTLNYNGIKQISALDFLLGRIDI